jgi:hypothetical protein
MHSFSICGSAIEMRYGLDGRRIKSQCWQFSTSVQTGPEAHPAPYTIGTGFFLGVKRPGRGVYRSTPCSIDVKERVELYLYCPSGPSRPVLR